MLATHGRHEGAVFPGTTGTEDGAVQRISSDARRTDRVTHTG